MEILAFTVFAILSTAVLSEELEEKKREKKDIGKLQNLGLGYGGKFSKGSYYPSGGYLPPAYNYDYNYERRPYYPSIGPQCDCRVPPPPPPQRCGPYYQSINSQPSRNYITPRPIPPSAPVDDTVVIYPAQPSFQSQSPPPVLIGSSVRTPSPPTKLQYDSGYNYDRPAIPFKK